jgi:hypothetical protein
MKRTYCGQFSILPLDLSGWTYENHEETLVKTTHFHIMDINPELPVCQSLHISVLNDNFKSCEVARLRLETKLLPLSYLAHLRGFHTLYVTVLGYNEQASRTFHWLYSEVFAWGNNQTNQWWYTETLRTWQQIIFPEVEHSGEMRKPSLPPK